MTKTYQAQLDIASSQSDQVWKSTQILHEQLLDLNTQLTVLENTATVAARSFHQNNLDAGLYVSLKSTLLSMQLEEIRLRATLDKAQAALATLLCLPFEVPHDNTRARNAIPTQN